MVGMQESNLIWFQLRAGAGILGFKEKIRRVHTHVSAVVTSNNKESPKDFDSLPSL